MQRPCRSVIVAVSENGVIGREGQLPWRLSTDLKRFRELTMGHCIVMGRKTYESIGRPLPGRTSIVVTRQPDYEAPGCRVVTRLEDAWSAAADDDEVFVIGGAEIYRATLRQADRLYVTRVHTHMDGDTFLPDIAWDEWRQVADERHEPGPRDQYAFSFQVYERR